MYLIEYYPEKFNELKKLYKQHEILTSLLSPYNYNNLIQLMQEEGGRSGAFIFSTYDKKFIIKTITSNERKYFLNTILPKYLERVLNYPESKLVRILGVYKIYPMNQDVIIMENILINKEQSIIFDLKGSKVARFTTGIDDPYNPPLGHVLKDENFLIYNKLICLKESEKNEIIDILTKDFLVLKEAKVIDYSLLVGMYQQKIIDFEINKFAIITEHKELICLGIIDIFQEYNFAKTTERIIKAIFNKSNELSVAKPNEYYDRICAFIIGIFTSH